MWWHCTSPWNDSPWTAIRIKKSALSNIGYNFTKTKCVKLSSQTNDTGPGFPSHLH